MDAANIIIIVFLILILLWVISHFFFYTNIVYDIILDASKEYSESTNKINNSNLKETNNANFMLSVWFYIDNWGNRISNEKNILFLANTKEVSTPENLKTQSMGISKRECNIDDSNTINYKNLSVCLDNYENILNIDIETLPNRSSDGSGCFSRYIVKNIPIQKWNCLIISVDTKTMDVYLDGKLRNSFILHGPYKNDLGSGKVKNIYLGNIGTTSSVGFEGFITRVRYEPNSINPKEAYNIYKDGINASLAKSIFNKYSLKVSFLEYNKERGSFII